MRFIEMTGKKLHELVQDDELPGPDLHAAGVDDDSIVRVNEHGDIEVRRPEKWDVIGGLLGEYVDKVKAHTGLDFA